MFKWGFFIVRWIIIVDWLIESSIKRLLFKHRYTLKGQCTRCGKCCHHIGVVISSSFAESKILSSLIITFYEQVNGFTFLDYDSEQSLLFFKCNHFDTQTSSCLDYHSRPAMCRNYPFPRFFQKPDLIQDCGYEVELKSSIDI